MKTFKISYLFVPAFGLMVLSSCKDNSVGSKPPEEGTEIINEVNVEIPVHEGEVGLVINVREIFRKGYIATEAEVTFPNHSSFNDILEIDPVTNLASLRIPNEDLTDEQKNAFAEGVATDIVIYDEGQTVLGEHHDDEQVLDDSNIPLSIQTDLPYIKRPLNLREGTPYLLQSENKDGLITSSCSHCHRANDFAPDDSKQQFYFTPIENSPDANTFTVQHFGYAEGTHWYVQSNGWINLGGDGVDLPPGGPQEFVFEQDDDGWFRVRVAGTGDYLYLPDGCTEDEVTINSCVLQASNEKADRFRLITDNIDWNVEDRGTVYNQPIMPPGQIDFAYEATIRNCTSGILTETVGNTASRTSTRTTTTSESLQLFSSVEEGINVTMEVKTGGEVYGVTASVGASTNLNFTTSSTTSTDNTFSTTTEETSEVSRTRSLEIPAFTGVEVYDAVRTIKNARTPFTQVLRITASYKKNGVSLSGPEIITQMQFNFVEGVPAEIGDNYVDVSLKGQVDIDQMFEVETGANEIPGACK